MKRFFQERVASDQIADLGKGFAASVLAVLNSLKSKLTVPS